MRINDKVGHLNIEYEKSVFYDYIFKIIFTLVIFPSFFIRYIWRDVSSVPSIKWQMFISTTINALKRKVAILHDNLISTHATNDNVRCVWFNVSADVMSRDAHGKFIY